MAEYVVSLTDQVSANATRMVAALTGLATAMRGVQVASGSMTTALRESAPALKDASDAARGMAPAASSAASATSAMPPQLMAVKAAAVAATAALAGLVVGLYEAGKAAVAFTEMRAGITASLDALTGQGPEVVSMLDRLGKALPFTTEKMAGWSTQLASAGVRDLPGLQRGVMAVSSSMAIMRDAANPERLIGLIGKLREMAEEGKGEKFDTLTKKLKGVGIDVNDVARELGKTAKELRGTTVDATKLGDAIQNALINKGKGPLEAFGAESTQVWAKFKENISGLFADIGPEVSAFMGELRGIADEFTKDSATANVAKGAVTGLFHALFSAGTTALHAIHIGFLDLEIFALKAAIAVAPAVKALRGLWAEAEKSGQAKTALEGIKIVAIAIGGAFAVAAAAAVLLVGAIAIAAVGTAHQIGTIAKLVSGAANAMKDWQISAYTAASAFVSGLVKGIGDGVVRVVGAVKALGGAAVGAIKSVLHIQSPSRVMAEVGLNTARGMAVGIDEGQSDVARAARSLGGAAVSSSSVTNNSTSRGALNLKAEVHVHNYGGNALELTESAVGSMFERLASQAGLVPAEAA